MTQRLPPKPVSILPHEIEELADKIGLSRETETGRLERERLQAWVPMVTVSVGAQQQQKFSRLTFKQQLERLDNFESAAAAFMHQLEDEWFLERLGCGAYTEWLASGEWWGKPEHTRLKLDDRVREIEKVLAATRHCIDNLRTRLVGHRASVQMLVGAKLKETGSAAKPWLPWLTKMCLDYHHQHFTRLEPKVKESALADAMLELLNNNSGKKDQLAEARKVRKNEGA